jgi:transcription elongation factor Elf1
VAGPANILANYTVFGAESTKLYTLKRTLEIRCNHTGGMGKRKKSSKPIVKRVQPKLDKTFDCPFCNQQKTVEVRLDRSVVPMRGLLECGVCGASYQCAINALSEPVDVYSDWIDTIEVVNAGEPTDR